MFWRSWSSKEVEKDIYWALGSILSKRKLRRVRESSEPSRAIEQAAQLYQLDPEKLLGKVSAQLGLPAVFDPHPPRPNVVNSSGYLSEELKSWNVLPHYSDFPCGYGLTISDPTRVCIEEFRSLGIPISLGLGSQIEKAWIEYDRYGTPLDRETTEAERESEESIARSSSSSYQFDDMLPILTALAQECRSYGARDVRLLNGSRCCYEFRSNGNLYSGSLHPEFLTELHSFLSPSPILAFRAPDDDLRLLLLEREESELAPLQKSYRLSWEGIETSIGGSGRILLIDDDERFLFLLGALLKNQNYEVWSTSSAKEVLPQLIEGTLVPDVIVCDVHMPGMDGGGFLAALRRAKLKIPTLVLTSDEELRTHTEMVALGAAAFLPKAGDPGILLAWVENLRRRNLEQHEY